MAISWRFKEGRQRSKTRSGVSAGAIGDGERENLLLKLVEGEQYN